MAKSNSLSEACFEDQIVAALAASPLYAARDAVACHFDPAEKPKLIRLHCVLDEVIAA